MDCRLVFNAPPAPPAQWKEGRVLRGAKQQPKKKGRNRGATSAGKPVYSLCRVSPTRGPRTVRAEWERWARRRETTVTAVPLPAIFTARDDQVR